jgi:UDP-N-acetylmuramate--alanine ligase
LNLDSFKNIYFIGIGGIGMSALARYFNTLGKKVMGYDRVMSPLCKQLQEEGMEIHTDDRGDDVAKDGLTPENTLVISTPAVPETHGEKSYFRSHDFKLLKRSELLGLLTAEMKGLTVAGTHGKTTTSTMLAHVLKGTEEKTSAFLGGISSNYNTNLLIEKDSDWVVIEADEFDRSFLHLHPFASIITSTDADHLDIYKDKQDLVDAFQDFAELVAKDGFVVRHVDADVKPKARTVSYGINADSDYRASNLRTEEGYFVMDVMTPTKTWKDVVLGLPGIHNAENALSVLALLDQLKVDEVAIRTGLKTFKGVKRRFEYHIRRDDLVYIDDYAHHPTAIDQLLKSVRMMYPNKKITAVFQPHLYSRTNDFMEGFASALSRADETILMPIYPARELPMEGVTSNVLGSQMTNKVKVLETEELVLNYLKQDDLEVVLTIGAGDIDRIVEPLKTALS